MEITKATLLAQQLQQDNLPIFSEIFPFHVFDHVDKSGKRSRVFDDETTSLAMILTATLQDKSLKNSVLTMEKIHNQKARHILDEQNTANKAAKKRIAKSKIEPISMNTSAYSQARSRLPLSVLDAIFTATRNLNESTVRWHGLPTFCTDGTYLQMQDTKDLRAFYDVKKGDESLGEAYPQALLQIVMNHDTGGIHNFKLHNRHVSELELCFQLLSDIPQHSLLLADDLYNSFAMLAYAKSNHIDMIVPARRNRKYIVEKTLAEGDQIVRIKKTDHPKWLAKTVVLPEELLLRRIEFLSVTDGRKMTIHSTILNENISAQDIVLKYFTRWQIELSIRDIKILMDMDIVRSKTQDMAKKEITSTLIAYNLIRNVINQSIKQTGFSPSQNVIRYLFKDDPYLRIDKLGRTYHHWSPGRLGYASTFDSKMSKSKT